MDGLFESFTGGIAVAVVGLLVFFIFRSIMKTRPRKVVQFLRPRDRRGEDLVVTKETDRSITCGRSNPIHRFIKVGSGYVFPEKGKSETRFWGVEGTAYTAELSNPGEIKSTVADHLKALWGEKFYNRIPDEQKNAIEKDKIGVIVEPVPIKEEEYGFPTMTSDDVNDEGDSVVLQRIAKATEPSSRREFFQMLIGIAIGFGLGAILRTYFHI